MTIEEKKQIIRNSITIQKVPRENKGGQAVALVRQVPILLTCEDLGLEIKIDYFRSDINNIELAKKLFETALTQIIY